MNRRRPNQGGAPKSSESVSRNTRSSGNPTVPHDDNAGMPRRQPGGDSTAGRSATGSADTGGTETGGAETGAERGRGNTRRGRGSNRERSASPVRERRGTGEGRRRDPPVRDDIDAAADDTADSNPTGETGDNAPTDVVQAVPLGGEQEVSQDASQEVVGETGARERHGSERQYPTLVHLLAEGVLLVFMEVATEHIQNNHNFLGENLRQPDENLVGEVVQRFLARLSNTDHHPPLEIRYEQPQASQAPTSPSGNAASSSNSTNSGADSSTTHHPQSTVSEVSVTDQEAGTRVYEVFNRRMLLQEDREDGAGWRSVGHVDWMYTGGRSVDCLYHGLRGAHIAIRPPHDVLIDYVIDAQRILNEFSEEENRADDVDMEEVHP